MNINDIANMDWVNIAWNDVKGQKWSGTTLKQAIPMMVAQIIDADGSILSIDELKLGDKHE